MTGPEDAKALGSPAPEKIAFFGHHKAGSRFFRNTLVGPLAQANGYEIVRYEIRRPPFHFTHAHDLDLKNIDFDAFASPGRKLLSLANTNERTLERALAAAPDLVGLRVVRDPRQMLVSGYFHHRERHADEHASGWVWDGLKSTRPRLQTLPLEEGLLWELDHITGDVLENQIAMKIPSPRIRTMKLEDFNGADSYAWPAIHSVVDHMCFDVRPPLKLARTFSDSGGPHWSEVFTPRIREVFKSRWAGLLIDLGYEQDDAW